MKNSFWKKPETLFAVGGLCLGALGVLFLGTLIAEPKVLFGRSLTAITPSLFPSIVLTLLAILCAVQLLFSFRIASDLQGEDRIVGWRRGAVFFGVMTIYALIMGEIGFIISSALAIAVLSWYIGNRSILQIVLISILAPFLLYLAATRLLAVSLPELNAIQLGISQVLDMLTTPAAAIEPVVSQ